MSLRRLAGVTALCATVALEGWLALACFDADLFPAVAAPLEGASAPATAEGAPASATPPEGASGSATAEVPPGAAASVPTPEAPRRVQEVPTWVKAFDEWCLSENDIDRYLFSLYERTPKLDTARVSSRVKVKVKTKGRTRTISKITARVFNEDFTWKDAKAAEKAGMSLMQYVIGGVDPSFKFRLYRMLRAADDAGLEPGITSAFRDDYRQSIVSGRKAAVGSSFHGGSRRGGYAHGLAADLVSVKGETRLLRMISSQILWQWIDAHGREFGIGRPYLNRDPPHVGPIDGQEYVERRGRGRARWARWIAHPRHGSAKHYNRGTTKGARTASH